VAPSLSRSASTIAFVAACLTVGRAPAQTKTKTQTKKKEVVCSQKCMVALGDACCPAESATKELPAGGCQDLAACAAACDAGDGLSCARAGVLSRPPGFASDGDMARAYIYFDRGCRLGECRACWLGCERGRGDYEGLPGFEAAVTHDEADCKAGDPNACRKVATLHRTDGQYAAFEQRACDLGSAEACADLADAYGVKRGYPFPHSVKVGIGDPPPGPPGLCQKLTERACALGRVPSCVSVGYWRFRMAIGGVPAERALDEQAKRGSALLEPLCRRGEPSACRTMGEAYDELGQKPNAPPAFAGLGLKYLDHACSMNDAEGCLLLGVAQLRAQGFTGDTRAAAVVLQRSCSLGSWRGCVALSQITADRREAQELIDYACARGARGLMGIYANAGMPELPQPLNCSRRRGR
jgi:TPR repeat protein